MYLLGNWRREQGSQVGRRLPGRRSECKRKLAKPSPCKQVTCTTRQPGEGHEKKLVGGFQVALAGGGHRGECGSPQRPAGWSAGRQNQPRLGRRGRWTMNKMTTVMSIPFWRACRQRAGGSSFFYVAPHAAHFKVEGKVNACRLWPPKGQESHDQPEERTPQA